MQVNYRQTFLETQFGLVEYILERENIQDRVVDSLDRQENIIGGDIGREEDTEREKNGSINGTGFNLL